MEKKNKKKEEERSKKKTMKSKYFSKSIYIRNKKIISSYFKAMQNSREENMICYRILTCKHTHIRLGVLNQSQF